MKQHSRSIKFWILYLVLLFLIATYGCQNNSNLNVPVDKPKSIGDFPLDEYWRKDFDSELVAMAWGSGELIIGIIEDGYTIIQAFDVTTGSSIWKYEFQGNSIGVDIMVVDESVYVVFAQKLYGLDLKTGELLFESDIQAASINKIAAFSNKNVFVVQVSDGVNAVDRNTGKQSWKFFVGRGNVDVFSDTKYELVYIIHGKELNAINEQDGSLAWQIQIGAQRAIEYYEDFIYYSNSEVPDGQENHLKSLSLNTKKVLWDIDLNREIKCVSTTNDNIIVVTNQTLAKLDKLSGKKVWEYYVSPNVYCPIVIQNKIIFLKIGDSNQIIAIKLEDGSFLGQLDFEDSIGIGYEIPKDNLLNTTEPYPMLAFYLQNSLFIYK